MTCEEVQEELVALLDEELDAGAAAALRSHLDRCAPCARELGAFRRTRALAADTLRLNDPVPPRFDELWSAVEAGSARRGSESRPPRRARGGRATTGRVVGFAAAAAAVLAVFVYGRTPTETIGPQEATVAQRASAGSEIPVELREHPDMFVDFVIVKRLGALQELPDLIEAAAERRGAQASRG